MKTPTAVTRASAPHIHTSSFIVGKQAIFVEGSSETRRPRQSESERVGALGAAGALAGGGTRLSSFVSVQLPRAWGYVDGIDIGLLEGLDRVRATLVKIVR